MSTRALATTRAQVEVALAAEDRECMDRWLAQDALAAHDLLDLVRRLSAALAERTEEGNCEPDGAPDGGWVWPCCAAHGALDAAAPWLEA